MCRALKNKSDLENFLLKTLIFHFFVTLDAKLITAYLLFFCLDNRIDEQSFGCY
jgi:hypothetical protein